MVRIFLLVLIPYALILSALLWRKAPVRKAGKPISRGWGNRLRVLVVGATGGTGRQLVQQALDQGHQVTAFVRDPSKLQIEHTNLRVVKGDVLDYASVESAMRGQSAVLSALGHKRFFYPNKIQSDGMRHILRAMKTCDVPRLICETALGIGNSVGRLGLPHTFFILPLILPFYMWDKLRQEELIIASDRDWVIVRPGVLTNGEAQGNYRHGPKVGSYFWPVRIRRADVADFMLKQLTDDAYVGAAPGLGG
ncbi:MAG TPA: SDR family oxidoreductase [Chthoniobacterales bacterium]|nr:SDR family oxidoreductase [Chthoniobacterales bacterium]